MRIYSINQTKVDNNVDVDEKILNSLPQVYTRFNVKHEDFDNLYKVKLEDKDYTIASVDVVQRSLPYKIFAYIVGGLIYAATFSIAYRVSAWVRDFFESKDYEINLDEETGESEVVNNKIDENKKGGSGNNRLNQDMFQTYYPIKNTNFTDNQDFIKSGNNSDIKPENKTEDENEEDKLKNGHSSSNMSKTVSEEKVEDQSDIESDNKLDEDIDIDDNKSIDGNVNDVKLSTEDEKAISKMMKEFDTITDDELKLKPLDYRVLCAYSKYLKSNFGKYINAQRNSSTSFIKRSIRYFFSVLQQNKKNNNNFKYKLKPLPANDPSALKRSNQIKSIVDFNKQCTEDLKLNLIEKNYKN